MLVESSINAKACFDKLSMSGLRVHFIRSLPLTLSLSKGVPGETRQSLFAREGT